MLGPVASFETIKHLGTNGGGFFDANASHPFENPTPLTNLLLPADDRSAELDRALLRRNDRQPSAGLGALWRHGRYGDHVHAIVVVPEQAGTPILRKAGIETTGDRDTARRQYGGQGNSFRHRTEQPVFRGHHSLHHRQRELDA